jgi:hypothetical protein
MLKRSSRTIIVISLLLGVSGCRQAFHQAPPTPFGSIRNSVGMQLRVAEENTQPTLRIVLPGHPASDRAIEVIFSGARHSTTAWEHRRKSDLPLSTGAIRRATALATV